jgi:hypothetical protein
MTLDRRSTEAYSNPIRTEHKLRHATRAGEFPRNPFRFCPQPSTYCHCAWTCGNRLHLIFSIQVLAKRYDLENAETPAIAL